MNPLISQLLQLGPGLAAGAKGNGQGMSAFMESFRRTSEMLERQEQERNQISARQQDRERLITRQDDADKLAREDRARQQAMQTAQLPGVLAQGAAGAETVPDAEQSIDALYRILAPQMGGLEQLGGVRDVAMQQAGRTITARQKRQVGEFVEAALKTSFVADNPDADPEIQNLPAHVAGVLGKPTARLSELQQFAQLPVGKPQGKTRIPAAAGSFEDYVEKAYGQNPTADQILAGRKAYQQSDDRAPRVTVNTGDGIDRSAALKFQDDYARDSKPYLTMREAYQRVKSAKPDAAGDLSLIFAYMKILDPNSVVREQEFANAQNAAGVPARIRNQYNKVMEGTRLAPEQRQQFQAQAEALFESAKTNQRGVRKTYSSRAQQWKIPETIVLDEEDEFLGAPAISTGPKVGDRRKVKGQLAEWDGKGWLPVVK